MKAVSAAVIFLASVSFAVAADDNKQALKDSFKTCTQKYNVPKPSSMSAADLNSYLQFAKDNPTLIACFYDCTFKGAGLLTDSGFATDALKNDLNIGKSSSPACVYSGDDIAACGTQANAVQPSDPSDPECERTQAFIKCFLKTKCNRP